MNTDTIPTDTAPDAPPAIADDLIPAADAVTDVIDKLNAAIQGELPGIIEPFNWEGAYLELEAMSVEADRLHSIWERDAERAKTSKRLWEAASERRDLAALEFRRRRLAKGEAPVELAPGEVTDDAATASAPEAEPAAQVPAGETIAAEAEHHYPEKKPRRRRQRKATIETNDQAEDASGEGDGAEA